MDGRDLDLYLNANNCIFFPVTHRKPQNSETLSYILILNYKFRIMRLITKDICMTSYNSQQTFTSQTRPSRLQGRDFHFAREETEAQRGDLPGSHTQKSRDRQTQSLNPGEKTEWTNADAWKYIRVSRR